MIGFRKLLIRFALRLSGCSLAELKPTAGFPIDVEKRIVDQLKKRGYVEHLNGWRKGFVRVIMDKDKLLIGHDIKGNKLTVVSNPLLTLNDFINYFERI